MIVNPLLKYFYCKFFSKTFYNWLNKNNYSSAGVAGLKISISLLSQTWFLKQLTFACFYFSTYNLTDSSRCWYYCCNILLPDVHLQRLICGSLLVCTHLLPVPSLEFASELLCFLKSNVCLFILYSGLNPALRYPGFICL